MSTVFKMELKEPPPSAPVLTVVDTLPSHVRILGQNLRDRDMETARSAGEEAHRALWRIYRRSMMSKTIFVGDEIVAIFGCVGVILGRTAKPWMVASSFVEDYPMRLSFCYRNELRNMLRYFLMLEDYIMVSDKKTIRLMKILGFKFDEPQLMNGINYMRVTLSREA